MSTPSYPMLEVLVSDIEVLTPLIKQFSFKRVDGLHFPPFSGGSHVIVQMGNTQALYANAYSLMGDQGDLSVYRICVRRDESGRGGSCYLHDQIKVGDRLLVSSPHNLFELSPGQGPHVLIAGGIGITPFIPQLNELAERSHAYELHYAIRSIEHGAWLDRLQTGKHAPYVSVYVDAEGRSLNVDSLLSRTDKNAHIYVCGPSGLISSVLERAPEFGFSAEQIHYERFSTVSISDQDQPFTVVLNRSGKVLQIPSDRSILSVLEDHQIPIECLCREGVCGTCETRIIEGEADHRDQYLDDSDKQSQTTLMVCVSRSKGPRIVLDL